MMWIDSASSHDDMSDAALGTGFLIYCYQIGEIQFTVTISNEYNKKEISSVDLCNHIKDKIHWYF